MCMVRTDFSNPRRMGDQGNPPNEPLTINELLCYVTNNIKRSTTEQIVKSIYRYYDIDEIIAAKKILYAKNPELGEYPKRITSVKRSEQEAHSVDIVESLVELDSKGKNVLFVAINLNRIPRWDPHETDHLSILEKIAKLEGRMNNAESVMSENTAHLIKIDDTIEKKNVKIEECEKAIVELTLKDDSPMPVSAPYSNSVNKGLGNIPAPIKGPIEPCGPPKPVFIKEKGGTTGDGVVNDRSTKSDVEEDATRNKPSDAEFILPREQRLKQVRRSRTIVTRTVGKAKFRGGPPPVRDFFVYRVLKPATDEDIKDFLCSNEITVSDVKKISNVEAKYCSFKVSVSLNDVDKVLKPNIWPEGVKIRKFVKFSKKQ